MSIVTRTGDSGTTGLFGGGRVSKSAARLHAYGTVDELNAVIGAILTGGAVSSEERKHLERVQHLLFRLGADLATPLSVPVKIDRIGKEHIDEVERWIADQEPKLPHQTQFLLPGGSRESAELHLARTVCRRAERWVVAMEGEEVLNPAVRILLNRLGDYLFIAARGENLRSGKPEVPVQYD
ncbi:MAG: cob(I)yrinic acid a,c-diamide adenosyltransferase [Patescibacteria group bacterium]